MKINKINQLQQGDCVLTQVSNSKELSGITKSKGLCILAYGERSGHCHSIELEEDEASLIEMGDKILLKLTKEGVLRHQEHKPITVPPGLWEIGDIHEYDYFSKMVRKVVD